MHPLHIKTADGVFTAWLTPRGLARLEFPANAAIRKTAPPLPQALRPLGRAVTLALQRCLTGRAPAALPPMDLCGTAFQKAVWQALLSIPAGRTATYSQVAEKIKAPRATRAVGSACGANPVPIFVPCHRVLPKTHGLGGFSAGLEWKRLLLAREGFSR